MFDDVEMKNVDVEIMKKKLEVLKQKRKRIHLKKQLKKTRAKKIMKFSSDFNTNRSVFADELQKKKLMKTVDFRRYKKSNQRKLNIFIKKYKNAFDIKLITYSLNRNKILYAQRFLKGTSAKN